MRGILLILNLLKSFKNYTADKEFLKFIQNNPRENTCISALLEDSANIGTISETGKFILK